jgi:hypothetical protein
LPALAAAVSLALGLGTPARSEGPAAIAWRSNPETARAEASARGLPLWIQFTGPWCPGCRKLERETLCRPEVVALAAANFVPVKLRSDEHETLAVGLGLTQLPATVIIGPDGAVVAKTEGYLGPDAYLGFLRGSLVQQGRQVRSGASGRTPALGGYCPVSLVDEHRLVRGRPETATDHDGSVFVFASPAARARFRKDPARYAPLNGGRCPVGVVDRGESAPGSARHGVLYAGHLFLCRGEAERRRFLKAPERYARVDPAGRSACHHCWALATLLHREAPSDGPPLGGRDLLSHDPSTVRVAGLRAGTDTR